LGISLHSTLTYRKRACGKLGISSLNELFGIALKLLTSLLELTPLSNRRGARLAQTLTG
jgi:hypothetical protein